MSSSNLVLIEEPDCALLETPIRVSRNGKAVQVRSKAQISESASAPVPGGESKKQLVASSKYVCPGQKKVSLKIQQEI